MKLKIELDLDAVGYEGFQIEEVLNHLAYRMPRDYSFAVVQGDGGAVLNPHNKLPCGTFTFTK